MKQITPYEVIDGQLKGARQVPSPNFNQRPAGTEIQMIVVHNISLPPSQFGEAILNSFFRIN